MRTYFFSVKFFTYNAIFIMLISEASLNMSKNNNNNQNRTNYAPFSHKKINQRGEISPVDDDYIQVIKTKPASNYQTSPIGRERFVLHSY